MTMIINEFYVKDRRAIAITSIAKSENTIYLGLTGGSHSLARFDTSTQEITLCTEVFPWLREKRYCTKIHNSMGTLADGSILIGEGNHFTWDGLPVYSNYLKSELPELMLKRKHEQGYTDVTYSDFCLNSLNKWNRESDDPGGKIVRYYPSTDSIEIVADMPKYLYSQSMIVDAKLGLAYVNTIPDNHFLVVDIEKKSIRDLGRISEYAHHNMVIAPNGLCYGGWMDYYNHTLKLLKYDPHEQRLRHLDTIILKDVGAKIAGNQGIDQWVVTRDGEIYTGMVANSLLFRFYWEEENFELIGQAEKSGRMATIDEDGDGIIWLGAGYPNMHLVRFDKKVQKRDNLIDCGIVNDNNIRCYFHASCYHQGKLYLGETDGFTPSLHVIDLKNMKGDNYGR